MAEDTSGFCKHCAIGEHGSCEKITGREIKGAKCACYDAKPTHHEAHPMAEMLTCAKCKAIAPLGTKFCAECGTQFTEVGAKGFDASKK